MQKLQSGWGSAPDPDGGAYSAPPYPLAGREGATPPPAPTPALNQFHLIAFPNPPVSRPAYGPDSLLPDPQEHLARFGALLLVIWGSVPSLHLLVILNSVPQPVLGTSRDWLGCDHIPIKTISKFSWALNCTHLMDSNSLLFRKVDFTGHHVIRFYATDNLFISTPNTYIHIGIHPI